MSLTYLPEPLDVDGDAQLRAGDVLVRVNTLLQPKSSIPHVWVVTTTNAATENQYSSINLFLAIVGTYNNLMRRVPRHEHFVQALIQIFYDADPDLKQHVLAVLMSRLSDCSIAFYPIPMTNRTVCDERVAAKAMMQAEVALRQTAKKLEILAREGQELRLSLEAEAEDQAVIRTKLTKNGTAFEKLKTEEVTAQETLRKAIVIYLDAENREANDQRGYTELDKTPSTLNSWLAPNAVMGYIPTQTTANKLISEPPVLATLQPPPSARVKFSARVRVAEEFTTLPIDDTILPPPTQPPDDYSYAYPTYDLERPISPATEPVFSFAPSYVLPEAPPPPPTIEDLRLVMQPPGEVFEVAATPSPRVGARKGRRAREPAQPREPKRARSEGRKFNVTPEDSLVDIQDPLSVFFRHVAGEIRQPLAYFYVSRPDPDLISESSYSIHAYMRCMSEVALRAYTVTNSFIINKSAHSMTLEDVARSAVGGGLWNVAVLFMGEQMRITRASKKRGVTRNEIAQANATLRTAIRLLSNEILMLSSEPQT